MANRNLPKVVEVFARPRNEVPKYLAVQVFGEDEEQAPYIQRIISILGISKFKAFYNQTRQMEQQSGMYHHGNER